MSLKIHIFGSDSGTEPMPGRHHTSWALEYSDRLYWFDAGETCSYTAHLMGLDLLKIRTVCISHPHIDHVGGLANLFSVIRKLTWVKKCLPENEIGVFVPELSLWNAVLTILCGSDGSLDRSFATRASEIERDGVIFDGDGVTIETLHNLHLGVTDPWRSYSFRIRADGKTIVFTGDIKSSEDVDRFLREGCDLLLTETGHHAPDAMPRYIREHGYLVGQIAYVHHGRKILNEPAESERLIREAWDRPFEICHDAQTIEL